MTDEEILIRYSPEMKNLADFVMVMMDILEKIVMRSSPRISRDEFLQNLHLQKGLKNCPFLTLKITISISMENALNRKRRNRPINSSKITPIILKVDIIILIVITSQGRFIDSTFHLFNRLEEMIFLSWDI